MASPDPEKLKELENRIARVRATNAPKPVKEEHHTMANMAWRMVIELVAGIAIGFGIGFGLDWLFGTMPLFNYQRDALDGPYRLSNCISDGFWRTWPGPDPNAKPIYCRVGLRLHL